MFSFRVICSTAGNSQMTAKSYASNANNSQEFGSERDNSCIWRMLLFTGHWYSRSQISWSCAQIRIKKVLTMIERSEISDNYVSISFRAIISFALMNYFHLSARECNEYIICANILYLHSTEETNKRVIFRVTYRSFTTTMA